MNTNETVTDTTLGQTLTPPKYIVVLYKDGKRTNNLKGFERDDLAVAYVRKMADHYTTNFHLSVEDRDFKTIYMMQCHLPEQVEWDFDGYINSGQFERIMDFLKATKEEVTDNLMNSETVKIKIHTQTIR